MKSTSAFIICIIIAIIIASCIYFYLKRKIVESLDIVITQPPESQLGNYLSTYFHQLGKSILLKQDFSCKSPDITFVKYLPNYIKYEYDDIYNDFIKNGITETMFNTTYNCPECAWFVDDKKKETFWLSMKPLVHKLIDDALTKANLKIVVDMPTIHFRCADTPFIKHSQYHFQRFSFFKQAINDLQNKMGTSIAKILLLSCNFHNSTTKEQDSCNKYANLLKTYLEDIGYSIEIQCDSAERDFATLFYSPAVISSGSSFSFMSGFFGDGIFISGGHIEENSADTCHNCGDWLYKGFDIKHSAVLDYYNTDLVGKLLLG